MDKIKTFQQLSKKNIFTAGGKGASLGEMTHTKIPIPPGFVILAPVYKKFLKETNLDTKIQLIIDKVKYHNSKMVDLASKKIRTLIQATPFPEDIAKDINQEFKKLNTIYVAVRSSATAEDSSTASWAGELESYLNITQKTLLKAIKDCWSSLFTSRAIFYRYEKKMLKTEVLVAVVIQKMVQSKISGITFTVHPVTQNKNQMIIEAGWGLGEAIVSGQITPDSYIIDKRDWSILDINISSQQQQIIKTSQGTKMTKVKKIDQTKQKLEGNKIIELAKLCRDIEKHYKFPCDIEWAFEKGKFYITQSRPITTL